VLGGGGEWHSALAALSALAVINLLHLAVGEQAPTYLGIERTRTIAKYGAPILYWWTRILSPVIRLADWLAKALLSLLGVEITRSWAEDEAEEEFGEAADTRGEVLSRMGDVLTTMDLSRERRQEVINALAIDVIRVADIMVDRDDVVAVSTERSTAEHFETTRETPHTRFPLVGSSLDDVVGTVYVPSLLNHLEALERGDADFADIAAAPMSVSSETPVSELIDQFQAEGQELAVVVDGTTVGLVTATDAFEAIAGELEDPLDRDADADGDTTTPDR
jgi:CBS domain containing-hemolysin-like protein